MDLINSIKYLKDKIFNNKNDIIENKQKITKVSSLANDTNFRVKAIIDTTNKLIADNFESKSNYDNTIIGGLIASTNANYSNDTFNSSLKLNNIINVKPKLCSLYATKDECGDYNSETKKYEYKVKISNDNDSYLYTYSLNDKIYYATEDCKDEIDMLNNKTIRRVLFKKFFGLDAEGWQLVNSQKHSNTLLFKSDKITNIVLPASNTSNISNLMNVNCTKLTYKLVQYEYLYNNDIEGVSIDSNGYVIVSILKTKLSSSDLTGFKDWLSKGYLSIGFKKITPSEYVLTNTDKVNLYPNSTIELLNTIVPKIEIEYLMGVIPTIQELEKKINELSTLINTKE
jgi:hypothetical protein